ncbi:MAG: 2-oxo acid dehydrogenase subunit E2 [Lachnospiraceae bacterium]|nr:2-oxo acid dehydrogenase subunit E2 [Lachnospiraceae bacterium]
MASFIVMPKSGVTVETCIMGGWNKKVGDEIAIGDILFEYETDKAVFEYRATEKDAGTLLAILYQEGDDVPVLKNVCIVGAPGEDISRLLGQEGTSSSAAAGETDTAAVAAEDKLPANEKGVSEPPSGQAAAVQQEPSESAATGISPRARKLAEDMGLRSLEGIRGSGPMGRVIERDVRAYAIAAAEEGSAKDTDVLLQTAPATASEETEYEDRKLSNIRKVIARNMQQSLATMAQLTHNASFDATELLAYRKRLKKAQEGERLPNITVNDMIIFAVSRVILGHPELNAYFMGESMRYFRHANIGVAVDTPRGLMVPTIFRADEKSLKQIAVEMKELAAACQKGNIMPDRLSGATFTISNLGPFGIEHFTPVINPPQTGILGVDCTVERVRSTQNGIEVYPAMGLSLTYDHRALDGAPASRFLQEICSVLENFTALLAG